MLLYPDSYRQVDDASCTASSLVSPAWLPAQPGDCDHRLPGPDLGDEIASILDAPFARDQWSQRYLQSLSPIEDAGLIPFIFQQSSHDIVSRAETFHFHNPGHAAIQFKAVLAAPIGQPQRLALIVQILDANHKLVGFWRKTYWRNAQQELESHFDMLKTRLDCEALRGLSKAIKPYFDQLNRALGVVREFVEADWIGRLVWADYYDIDEAHFYIEDGCRLSTLEVMRRNFDRFLICHDIQLADLTFGTPTGVEPLTHLDQLTSPGDFARIEHRDGVLVDVDVLLDDPPRRVEPQSLPVGKAFMLADFTDLTDNTVTLIDGYYGERLSDRAMPYWFGVRPASRSRSAYPHLHRKHRFERHEIVIVGAGLAGLTAAARLEEAGCRPAVFEANPSRVGGRLRSLALERRADQIYLGDQWLASAGSSCVETTGDRLGIIEAGGEFIGRHHMALQTLAQELGLGLIRVNPALYQPHILVSPSSGTVLTLDAFAAQYKPALNRIRKVWRCWEYDDLSPQLAMLSLEHFFDRMQAPELFRRVILGAVRAQFGTEMRQVRLRDWFDMQPFDQEGHLTLFASDEFSYRMKGGLQQLPQALVRRLSQSVRMGHTLTELRSADGNQSVLDFRESNGEGLRVFADFVILTVPINPFKRDVVCDLPVGMGRALSRFRRLPMGDNAKTIAFFRRPFWRSHVPDTFFYLSAPHFTLWEPAMETMETTLYPLVVYIGGDTAQAASEPDATIEHVLAHLEYAFPTIRQDFVTAAQPVHWPSYPFAQGGYTGCGAEVNDFESFGHDMHREPLSRSHLALAGEALSPNFRGFAEGAVETGLVAADRVISFSQSSIKP